MDEPQTHESQVAKPTDYQGPTVGLMCEIVVIIWKFPGVVSWREGLGRSRPAQTETSDRDKQVLQD